MKVFILFFIVSIAPLNIFGFQPEKKAMKILMLVACFPKLHNVSVMNQITGLIDRGHDVTIYSFSKGDFINIQKDVIKYDLISKMISKLPDSLDEYDIVMFQMGHKLFNIRKTHNYKGKIVVCMRGYDITGYLKEHPNAYNEYFETCDLFLPVCRAFKNLLIKEGCPRDKVVVQHSSIDCAKFKFRKKRLPMRGSINWVSAGRLVEKKGLIYSILAFERLLKKYPNMKYTIIGEGVLKDALKHIVRMLGLQRKIKFVPLLIHEEYINILNKSHIFILPSVTAQNNNQEGIANVLKEAMAVGVLVITTKHSGNAELITNGVSGFLLPERDIDSICYTIEHILRTHELWVPMQVAGAKKVKKDFDKEKESDKLEAILYNLCFGKKK